VAAREREAANVAQDAIRMLPEVPNLPALDRDHMWLGKDELLTWNPRNDGAKR